MAATAVGDPPTTTITVAVTLNTVTAGQRPSLGYDFLIHAPARVQDFVQRAPGHYCCHLLSFLMADTFIGPLGFLNCDSTTLKVFDVFLS